MTAGENLLFKIIQEGDTKMLVSIDFDWLEDEEIPQYNFIIGYFKDYGKLPSLKLYRSTFAIKTKEVEDEADYFLNELRDRHIYTSLVDKLPTLIKKASDDSLGSLDKIRDLITKLSSVKDTELYTYGSDIDSRFDSYEKRIVSGGVTYLPTGDPYLDKLMFGYKATDLITIGGRPGTKKTWILLYLLLCAEEIVSEYMPDRKILLVSNEIGREELLDRLDTMRFRLPYTDFLKGDLSTKAQKKYERGLERLKDKPSNIVITTKCRLISDLDLLVKLHKPAIVFLDGSYLMEPKMAVGWEKVTFITQNLKAICMDANVPIINTTQSSRRKGKGKPKTSVDAQDDFAFADSYSQDSDLAMLLYPDDDSAWNNKISGMVAKGRSIDLTKANFYVSTSLVTMDFFFEQEEVKELDEDEETIDY